MFSFIVSLFFFSLFLSPCFFFIVPFSLFFFLIGEINVCQKILVLIPLYTYRNKNTKRQDAHLGKINLKFIQ